MTALMRAGRFTGLTSVAAVDLPPDLAHSWAQGLVQSTAHPDPEIGHYHWRRWSDVDLDVFLLSLCGVSDG